MLAYAYTTVIPREFIYLVFVATYALVLLVKTKLLLYVVVIPNDDLCLCLHLWCPLSAHTIIFSHLKVQIKKGSSP